MRRNPLLYYAVEEFLECAKIGYYSSGIIVLSQLLNLFNKKTPSKRHEVAHEILVKRPNREDYEQILESFKKAALNKQNEEITRYKNPSNYEKTVRKAWDELIASHKK